MLGIESMTREIASEGKGVCNEGQLFKPKTLERIL